MTSGNSLPPLFDEFPPTSSEAWEEQIRDDLGDADITSTLQWNSVDGVSLSAYQRREDLTDVPHVSGDAPSPLIGYSTPPNQWRIRQDIKLSQGDQTPQLARQALQGGGTDLGLSFNPNSTGEEIDWQRQFDDLDPILSDISSENASLHLDRGPAAAVLFCALREQLQDKTWSGSVGYDPVAALATGTLNTESTAFDLTSELVTEVQSSALRTLTVDMRPYHYAGASAVQELAYTLGSLSESLAQLLSRNLSLSTILPRLQIVGATSTSYFLEIAKLRALRLLIPQVIGAYASEAGESINVEPTDLFVQTETSRRSETLYDPYVNMLRGTTEAMAAVLGGCDVLNVRPYDACLRRPSPFGNRIARNVQLILREEAHFDLVADPTAGSYYVESATDQLAQRAWDQFQELEDRGGILSALKDGSLQADIENVRTRRFEEVEERSQILVGTNHYPNLGERRLEDVKDSTPCNNGNKRAVEPVQGSLDGIRAALRTGRDLFSVLRGVTQGQASFEPLSNIRLAQRMEAIRLRTERASAADGPPVVFLAPLGPPGPRSARATFARNVFGVAGFEVKEHLQFDSPSEAVATAAEITPDIFVLCSSDSAYPRLVPEARSALNDHGLSPLLVVAGHPENLSGSVPADDFVYERMPLREKLESFQRQLGLAPS